MYKVPSSDPPSTPNKNSINFPSTTPAGPPPSNHTHNSFTPAGPPPSTIFGSSQINTGGGAIPSKPTFNTTGTGSNNLFGRPAAPGAGAPTFTFKQGNGFQAIGSSPPRRSFFGGNNDDGDDEDAEGSEEEYEDETRDADEMDEEEDTGVPRWNLTGSTQSKTGLSKFPNNLGSGNMFGASRSMRDSRSAPPHPSIETSATQTTHDFLNIALGHASKKIKSHIQEPDDLILKQEEIFQELYMALGDESNPTIARKLQTLSRELPELWTPPPATQGQTLSKAASQSYKDIRHANYVASLLLQLHHPPPLRPQQSLSGSMFGKSSSLVRTVETPIPKVLLDWFNTHHSQSTPDLDDVLLLDSHYSVSSAFWDGLMTCLLRGRFNDAIMLLREADFARAYTATLDGSKIPGYRGVELDNIEKVVNDAIVALEGCPAVKSGDWDVKGEKWKIYRRMIAQAINSLRDFSEGSSYDRSARSSFGASVSVASRRAESKVPWTVYENLQLLYEHLLGNPDELINTAQEWVEATIALTVWWDGEDQEVPYGSLAASRLSLSRSQHGRLVDDSPSIAYRRKLSSSLSQIVNLADEDYEVNTASAGQIALACIFEERLEGALAILRCFSVPIAAAVEQIASIGKWGHSASRDIMKGFDKSDLMVLSFGKDQQQNVLGDVVRDEQLMVYAEGLSQKELFVREDDGLSKEGWQLAIQVLSRLDNFDAANSSIADLLDSLELDSTDRVDKVILQLNQMGFLEQADSIAERYADTLASNTDDYGPTLVYYARAHQVKKLHSILDLLISLSLVNSTAYPPLSEIDPQLEALLRNPKKTIGALARIDEEAAELLATSLSGYATIRKFYDLRDEDILAHQDGRKPAHRPLARRRAATDALMTLIASASTPIRGGLYDPDAEAVLQVDGLLVLLGEALPLLKLDPCPVNMKHLNVLLAAIEDLVSSPSLIREQCEECLRGTLATAHGLAEPSNSRDLLKKSVSALSEKTGTTASSQFSLVGSSLLSRSAGAGSAVLTERAWDWRRGFAAESEMKDVISVLRVTVADVVAKAWIEDDGFEE